MPNDLIEYRVDDATFGCPDKMHQECTNGNCKCVENQSLSGGAIVAIGVVGLFAAGALALGFYQAYKGIRPVYVSPYGGTNVYLREPVRCDLAKVYQFWILQDGSFVDAAEHGHDTSAQLILHKNGVDITDIDATRYLQKKQLGIRGWYSYGVLHFNFWNTTEEIISRIQEFVSSTKNVPHNIKIMFEQRMWPDKRATLSMNDFMVIKTPKELWEFGK